MAQVYLAVLEVEPLLEQRQMAALGEWADFGGDEVEFGHDYSAAAWA